jgi:hypothetical protein
MRIRFDYRAIRYWRLVFRGARPPITPPQTPHAVT